jgi:hypothetical protein
MRLWPALILAPLFALASLTLGYALVTPACETGDAWMVHIVFAAAFALALGSTLTACLALRTARREFLPLVATWTGVFFSAVILLQWAALFVLSPCTHSP